MAVIRSVDPITDDVYVITVCDACGEEGHDAPAGAHDPETGEPIEMNAFERVASDLLVQAVINLEVAVDSYTGAAYSLAKLRTEGKYVPGEGPIMAGQRDQVVKASIAVVEAMVDADVSLVDSTYAGNVMPSEIRPAAAQAELGTLRALRAARASATA